ncbi:MAG: CarD family transcriptional regulator, partial [Mariprofundaceae bacterium]
MQIYADSGINDQRQSFADQVRSQFEMVRAASEPSISPQELYAVQTPIRAASLPSMRIQSAPGISDFIDQPNPLHALRETLAARRDAGWRLALVAHGYGQQDRMLEALALEESAVPQVTTGLHEQGDVPLCRLIGYLDTGFSLPDEKLVLLTGRELLGQRLPRKRGRGSTVLRADVFTSLSELAPGDPVVHEDHGVGRYRGLETMGHQGEHDLADFLKIEYADKACVYVPVEDLARLHRYTGDDAPTLNKLGSEKWKRTRERVRRDLLAMAHELIEVEARRSSSKRPACLLEGELREAYEEFVARFPFEETDDQAEAIDAVLQDFSRPQPMDRVICGDVGFGKTEVAMRAAFV